MSNNYKEVEELCPHSFYHHECNCLEHWQNCELYPHYSVFLEDKNSLRKELKQIKKSIDDVNCQLKKDNVLNNYLNEKDIDKAIEELLREIPSSERTLKQLFIYGAKWQQEKDRPFLKDCTNCTKFVQMIKEK